MGWFGRAANKVGIGRDADGYLTPTTAANIFDRCAKPTYGRSLPNKMGAGGWPVEEPTLEEMIAFLALFDKIPVYPFLSRYAPSSPDYGTEYSCIITVHQWLMVLVEEKLLRSQDKRAA